MSYDATKLRLMGGVPGQQLFMYQSADLITDVTLAGYFDDAVEQYNLSSDDVILAVTNVGTASVLDGLVTTVSSGQATVSLLA